MDRKKLILLGGGGHCKSCIDVIETEGNYLIAGIFDKKESVGQKVLGYEIIATDMSIAAYAEKGYSFLITVGQIKSAAIRQKLFSILKQLRADVVSIISPLAYVSDHASIGKGTIVMHRATVNAGATIGENNILNTNCCIEHDTQTGSHCHISTHAVINGDCKLGNEIFIGSNATISNQVTISDKVIVGAGALVNKNLTEKGIYIGHPVIKL